MKRRLRVAPRAELQIRRASAWWLANRPKAPEAFEQDLERAFDLIIALPGVGEPVPHERIPGLRRLLLGRVRYHLYYCPDTAERTVDVLALWHTSRGSTPALEPPGR